MSDCIFCKIVDGEIPSEKVYEDDKVVAFNDVNPQSPVHILVIPKRHISSVKEIDDDNSHLVSHIHLVINKIAKDKGLYEKGFRIVNNCGEDGGQTVNHLHYHLLGGRQLKWPPG
ncbi:histidine triad nucleotide-binding protein [Dethiothermospora halolimnae]|uniref:histidine triad nucleotide-binding protein n=1 Tax=Dethiothermospora halolimnae TaxID=3114390 RepID=UPI003CCC31F5